jgi:hypothetical protein
MKVLVGIILLFLLVIFLWKPVEGFEVSDVAKKVRERSTALDSLTTNLVPISKVLDTVPKSQQYLVNFAPITMTYTGYLGEDVFDAAEFFKHAFALGVRSFVLPISTYKDDNKVEPLWPSSGTPAVVYRDATHRITSVNGLSIDRISRALVNALSVSSVQQKEPVLLKLEQVPGFVPDSDLKEKEYVDFMTQISAGLDPLQSLLLRQLGPYGSAVGARLESEILLQTPITDLAGKVILITDFDVGKYAKKAYSSETNSLLNKVHLLVRNSPPQGKISSYKTMNLSGVSSTFSPDLTRTTLQEAQGAEKDDAEAVALALNRGIQLIPLPVFDNVELIKPWKGAAWRVKSEDDRYTKPEPVKAATPSQSMNARMAANAQPGQIVI